MHKYLLEFIITTYNISEEAIKNSLTEFGESLEIHNCQPSQGKGRDFKIHINTEDPTVIFDICSQFGRIKSIKIN
jgi:dihydroxyacetone kinase-like predicted kinase